MKLEKAAIVTVLTMILIFSLFITLLNDSGKPQPNVTSSVTYSTTSIPPAPTAKIEHVVIIVLENQEFSNVIGNETAPYENGLAENYSLATNFYSLTHPSEPNHMAMIAGSTLNVTNDGGILANQRNVTNVVDLLEAHGLTWKTYQESIPGPCYMDNGPRGLYVVRHNPFIYIKGITSNRTYCEKHVVNLDNLYDDLASNQLPNYSVIVPNTANGGHQTNVEYVDKWLSGFMPTLLESGEFNTSVIMITYDEGTSTLGGGGHVATILIGPPSIIPGFSSSVFYNHYSILATVETIFGIGNLGRNDANATVMRDFFAINVLSPN
jgi:phosphatidylinositol-3-phosphatase